MNSIDLEKQIPDLETNRNTRLLALITLYGHGLCHDMADYLAETYHLQKACLMDSVTHEVVHSFVFLPDGSTLDAYGVNDLRVTKDRYARFSSNALIHNLMETLAQPEPFGPLISADIEALIAHLGLDLSRECYTTENAHNSGRWIH
jgi:hypothetical protein